MANSRSNAFLTNDQARAWINQNGVYTNAGTYDYFSCVSVDGLSRDFGDQTRVECPDPNQYGQFLLLGTYGGEISQLTTAMTGRFSGTEISMLYALGKSGCAFDIQIFTGKCQRPTDRADFDKVLVLEGVNITSWSTDPLIALQSGDRAVVNETVDLTVRDFFEIVNLVYSLTGEGETIHLELEDPFDPIPDDVVSIEYADKANCGSCEASDGCQRVFAMTENGWGLFSTDGGATWTTSQLLDSLAASPAASILDAMVYGNIYMAIDDDDVFWFVNIEDWIADDTTPWTQVASGITDAVAIKSYGAFGLLVTATGEVYQFVDQDTETVQVYDGAGIANVDLFAVDTLGSNISVAVGDNAIVYSNNGLVWIALTSLPAIAGTSNFSAVLVRDEKSWLVGTDDGELWATDNAGATWVRVAYPGWLAPTNGINDIKASNGHVIWMAQNDRLLRSIDGGHSWILEPNSRTNTFSVLSATSVAACSYNPNAVMIGGVDVTDSTAALVVGSTGA